MLTSGLYIIRNREHFVGRSTSEDNGPAPAPINVLPPGIRPPEWQVEIQGEYAILRAHGAFVIDLNDHVFAIFGPGPPPQRWKLLKNERGSPDSYAVVHADDRKSWVAPDEVNEQLLCRPLIIGPPQPPFFPPNEVFDFIRIDRD